MKRLGRLLWGFSLLGVGTVLLFVPGPGMTTIISGLIVLSREFRWAARAIVLLRNYLLGIARYLDAIPAPRGARRMRLRG
jgi:hypothetical protein